VKVKPTIAMFLVVSVIALLFIVLSGPVIAQTRLPSPLPTSRCSNLHNDSLHGKALWKHWIWHLRRSEYTRICNTITGESRWDPTAENSGGYAGLMQWGSAWYAWRWSFNPHNPVLSIRIMVYALRHPHETGGWSNWAGH
jgi:hypothetical protein